MQTIDLSAIARLVTKQWIKGDSGVYKILTEKRTVYVWIDQPQAQLKLKPCSGRSTNICAAIGESKCVFHVFSLIRFS